MSLVFFINGISCHLKTFKERVGLCQGQTFFYFKSQPVWVPELPLSSSGRSSDSAVCFPGQCISEAKPQSRTLGARRQRRVQGGLLRPRTCSHWSWGGQGWSLERGLRKPLATTVMQPAGVRSGHLVSITVCAHCPSPGAAHRVGGSTSRTWLNG